MQAIIDFFTGLADFFTSIVDFIVGFFQDLIYVIGLLGQFVLQIPSYFGWLPATALALLGTIFGVVVIYMVLNRK